MKKLLLLLLLPVSLYAQTIRPTFISQIQFTELTTAQEASMTLAEGSHWYNTTLNCMRIRLVASSVCIAGGGGRWDELTDPTAATTFLSDALIETLDFDFQAPFTTGTQVHFRQTTGNPTGGNFFGITVNDPNVLPFFISDGTNNVFQVERDGDTTIRNWLDQTLSTNFDGGDTTSQIVSLCLNDRGTTRWCIQKDASNEFNIEAAGIQRIFLGINADNSYLTGSVSSDHLFKDSAGLIRFVIDGGADRIRWGAAGDTNLFRAAANILATDDQFEVRSGANTVFKVKLDGDTEIRNFADVGLNLILDSGDTAQQGVSLLYRHKEVKRWAAISTSTDQYIIQDNANATRISLAQTGGHVYNTAGTSPHEFRAGGTQRVRIRGDVDGISFGSLVDVSVERAAHPNSVLGFSIEPTGRVFGMALFVGDPNTTGWGATEKGVMWFNTTSNTWKGWDGAAVVTLTTSIGTWLSLSDTPGTFTAGAFYNVNTGATALELSPLSEDADSLNSSIDFEAPQVSTTGTAAGEYRMHEPTATGTDYVALGAPASIAANIKFIVPAADGSADQVLKTDGSLVLGFTFMSSANLVAANKTITCNLTIFRDTGLKDTDDLFSVTACSRPGRDITITTFSCECDAGSPIVNAQRDDGTPANILTSNLTCTTGGATGTLSATEKLIAAADRFDFVAVSGMSGADQCSLNILATVDET